jgi:hypothetical protein
MLLESYTRQTVRCRSDAVVGNHCPRRVHTRLLLAGNDETRIRAGEREGHRQVIQRCLHSVKQRVGACCKQIKHQKQVSSKTHRNHDAVLAARRPQLTVVNLDNFRGLRMRTADAGAIAI